jgi:hypoxanthine phosphoribosyltransferase
MRQTYGIAIAHTVLFSAEVIAEKVRELAVSIDRDYGDDGLVVLTVLKGSAIFASDLVRAMDTETELAYLTASSYSDGFTPGDTLSLRGDIDLDIEGMDVLIVEDTVSPTAGSVVRYGIGWGCEGCGWWSVSFPRGRRHRLMTYM